MDKLNDHKGFWGPAEELIDRAKRLQKAIGINLKTISIRLVRYYAAEGVIDKPDRLGREAAYHYKHLLQLLLARKLSEHGVMLADIKILVSGQSALELEGKLGCSTQTIIDAIKHRRAKAAAEEATDVSPPPRSKDHAPDGDHPELKALTYQLQHVGESLKIVSNEVDWLRKTNLELAAQNEKLLHTTDEVHYLLRESTECHKYMVNSLERLTQRIDNIEAVARELETERHFDRMTDTVEQLTERMALLESSVQSLVAEIRSAKL
jgi:DNA-binding transcriptional MerR regulator